VFIKNLRKKIEDNPERPEYITTSLGWGIVSTVRYPEIER
jgi:DNA-binding response OmpR family regulator